MILYRYICKEEWNNQKFAAYRHLFIEGLEPRIEGYSSSSIIPGKMAHEIDQSEYEAQDIHTLRLVLELRSIPSCLPRFESLKSLKLRFNTIGEDRQIKAYFRCLKELILDGFNSLPYPGFYGLAYPKLFLSLVEASFKTLEYLSVRIDLEQLSLLKPL